jgi:GT2 family glycosyltransferase
MRIAVGIPACNEANRVAACVGRLLRQSGRGPDVVVVLANNCSDGTADRLRQTFGADPRLDLREVSLPPPYAHVGWARRLAMDAAADALGGFDDVLLTTDADTLVAPDWIAANVRALAAGCDAVAGAAFLMRCERAQLAAEHRRRLLAAGKYFTALAYLRAEQAPAHDPWPRHDYEGGASIALRLQTYRAIGGAPTLRTGEDRAMFDAVRALGGRVRHAPDVRVFTSCRLTGRAEGGTADTLELWGALPAHAPAHGLTPLSPALSGKAPDRLLSFHELDHELAEAQALARARRALAALGSAAPEMEALEMEAPEIDALGIEAPEIEAVIGCAVGERD